MHSDVDLILTLTGGLGAALLFGFLTQLLRLSPLVGYLIAGVVVGPFTPGFVAHSAIAEQFAELGVVLLMFGVGLHFNLGELMSVRRLVVPGALGQILAATLLGVVATRLFGWSAGAGVVFGLSVSVASTVVLLRVLADSDTLHTPPGHVAVGWLIVEDLFTVLVLVLLPLLAGGKAGQGTGDLLLSIGLALLKLGALVAFTLLAGRRAIPALLGYVARARSRDLFTLTVLTLALGIAVGSARLFGASMALGAFLAGMVVGQSEYSSRAAAEALPMRDAFAVLFFVSMGMLLDPAQLVPNAGLTAATLAVIWVGKPLVAFGLLLALKAPVRTALSVGLAIGQIGEFSFILAALGRQLGVLPERATQALVAASIVSITVSPFLFRLVDPLARFLEARGLGRGAAAKPGDPPAHGRHAILVGHGPVGRTLARLLRENGVQPVIIEQNAATVAQLVASGVQAVHGDASDPAVLERAGVRQAGSLVFAASGSPGQVVEAARALNPALLILARTTYASEVGAMREAGANVVVSAEGEVALAMTERLLQQLGAEGDQVDRARDRVRTELGGDPPAPAGAH